MLVEVAVAAGCVVVALLLWLWRPAARTPPAPAPQPQPSPQPDAQAQKTPAEAATAQSAGLGRGSVLLDPPPRTRTPSPPTSREPTPSLLSPPPLSASPPRLPGTQMQEQLALSAARLRTPSPRKQLDTSASEAQARQRSADRRARDDKRRAAQARELQEARRAGQELEVDERPPIESVAAEVRRINAIKAAVSAQVEKFTRRTRKRLDARPAPEQAAPEQSALVCPRVAADWVMPLTVGQRYVWSVHLRDQHGNATDATPAPLRATATDVSTGEVARASAHEALAAPQLDLPPAADQRLAFVRALGADASEPGLLVLRPWAPGPLDLLVQVGDRGTVGGRAVRLQVQPEAAEETVSPTTAVELPSAELCAEHYGPEALLWARDQPVVGALDLAFMIDVTGSMDAYLESCKKHMIDVVRRIAATPLLAQACERGRVRVGVVAYRDHEPQDLTFVTETRALTSDHASIVQYLETLRATGGGDYPEAVTDALRAVAQLEWQPHAAKMVVWLGDAPPHALGSSDDLDYLDGFARGDPSGTNWALEAHRCFLAGLQILAVGCENLRPTTEHVFRAVAATTGGLFLRLTDAQADTVLPDMVVAQACVAVDRQLTASRLAMCIVEQAALLQPLASVEHRIDALSASVRDGWFVAHLAPARNHGLRFAFRTLTRADAFAAVSAIARLARDTNASVASLDACSGLFALAHHLLLGEGGTDNDDDAD